MENKIRTFLHRSASFSLALAMLFLAYGLVQYCWPEGSVVTSTGWFSDTQEPKETIQPATVRVDLGDLPARGHKEFEVSITNVGSRPATLVGAPSLCVKQGCIESVGLPMIAPPHQSLKVVFRFDARNSGAVELKTEMYFVGGDQSGIVVPVTIVGHVAEKVPVQ